MNKRISFVLGVALVVNLFGMVAPARAQVTVPDVVGMTEDAARSEIDRWRLYVSDISYKYNDTVPYGQVISQDPEAGTWVARYSKVFLVICIKCKVPNVVGMTRAAAMGALSSRHLSYDNSWGHSDTVPRGYVISQDPEAGTWVRWNYRVKLVISLGPCPFVPDVVGMSESDASSAIRSAGYRVGSFSGYSDTVPRGYVISQNPAGGTRLAMYSWVRFMKSCGPCCPSVGSHYRAVPDVVGMSESDAVSAIKSEDLSVVISGHSSLYVGYLYSDTVPAGCVISQDPAGGTRVAKGSCVILVISLGPWKVPDVVGMSESDAASAINSAELSVGSMGYLYSDTVPDGCVISQYPAAGTVIVMDPGPEVDLDISIGPYGSTTVDVPDVEGKTEAAARSRITSGDLLVGYILREYSYGTDEGHVISQDPTAGTSVFRGTTVYLVISLGDRPMEITSLKWCGFGVPEVGVPFTILVSGYGFIPKGGYELSASISGPGSSIYGQTMYGKWDEVDVIYYDYGENNVHLIFVDVDFSCAASNSTQTLTVTNWRGESDSESFTVGTLCVVEVPAVVAVSESDAVSAIIAAGLSVGTIGYLYSDTIPAGCVISSYQRAGTVGDAGTEVDLTISMGPAPRDVPPIPVPPDASCLLAHWKLDEIEGAIAYDSSGNGNHGMVYGNPIWQPTGGIIDGTLEFDGDGDYVEIPKIGESVEFTYAMWVAQNQVGSGLIALIDHKDWVYGSVQFELRDGHPKVGINGAITPAGDLDAWGHTLAAGEWHHVALAKSATELLMYVDGEEAARSELITSDTVILGDGCIGAWVNPTWGQTGEQTRYFDGWVDDVRIYACALDENQIKALISALPSPVLSEALDTALSFTTGGSADWFSQTTDSYYEGEAAQSGDIKSYQESWMQTTVSGTGTVSFYWKVSSERYCDFLEFYIDGSLQEKISGSVDWQQMMYTISTSGSHVLEWRYVKDYVVTSGSDCGWVDKVEWVPIPPPPPDLLSEALDTALSFTTGGSADWFSQTSTSHYGEGAAQSGDKLQGRQGYG